LNEYFVRDGDIVSRPGTLADSAGEATADVAKVIGDTKAHDRESL